MTSVWRGHDRVLGRDVVVKVLHRELAADPSFRARFHEEAVNAARLTHPNIVALYDTGEQGDVAYIVMELVNGPTLREAIGRHGPLPPSRAARLSMEVAPPSTTPTRPGSAMAASGRATSCSPTTAR